MHFPKIYIPHIIINEANDEYASATVLGWANILTFELFAGSSIKPIHTIANSYNMNYTFYKILDYKHNIFVIINLICIAIIIRNYTKCVKKICYKD